jgi:glycosyltransferase involved in cell wall biosynthesis
MRILINGLAVFRGGHKTYFSNLIPFLGDCQNKHEFLLLHAPWQDMYDIELPKNVHRHVAGPKNHSQWKRILWEMTNLPRLLQERKIDILYSPVFSSALSSTIATVVDARNLNVFMTLENQHIRYRIRNWLLRRIAYFVAQRAQYIVFASEFSRNAALELLKIDPDKTAVIYHGAPPHFNSVEDFPISDLPDSPRPYILTVSTIQTHKNYLHMLDAFAYLCQSDDWNYDYLFAGGIEDKKVFKAIQERINKPDIKHRVRYLGEVDYNKLPGLYQKASLVALPTLREAFCLPLVEAMESEVPIAASNNSCMPEIAGEAAVYFNPYDIYDIAETIRSILSDRDRYTALIEAGKEQSAKYLWSDAAAKLVGVFEDSITKEN